MTILSQVYSGHLTDDPLIPCLGISHHPAIDAIRVCARSPSMSIAWPYRAAVRGGGASRWRGTPGVETLSEAPYQGGGTGDIVYEKLFADAEATAKYDSVYDRTPREVYGGEGGTMTITPPDKFGMMA